MSVNRENRRPLKALLGAVMIVPPIAVLSSLPWLSQQSDSQVFLLTGIAGALTVLSSFGLAVLQDRQNDEWARSNARFSSQWGWTVGAGLIALLLALPPFRDFIVSVTGSLTKVEEPNSKLVVLAFTLGFGTVVFTQGMVTTLLSLGWSAWMSRAPRDPS